MKRIARTPWICTRCLRQQQSKLGRRTFVGVASAHQPGDALASTPVFHKAADAAEDDRTLRKLFDSQSFWNEFSSTRQRSDKRSGLLQNKFLTSPQGFQVFTQHALSKCQHIVDEILDCSTVEQYANIVRLFDRLSDQLCRVIDLVDFIRNVHPSPQIQHAAAFAHSQMFEYMNILNTTPGLNDQLAKAATTPDVKAQWSQEEKITADILLKDFTQSVIEGPQSDRTSFVEISNEVVNLGNDLIDNMSPAKNSLEFSSSKLRGMDPVVLKSLTSWGTTKLPTYGPYIRQALRTVHDPDVRRDIYMATRTASARSIDNVEQLVQARADLAHLSGHESFAHMTLGDKMAQTPEAVDRFLHALAADNRPHVQADLNELLDIKKSDAKSGNFPDEINAWDRDYYTNRLRSSSVHAHSRPGDLLASYFSVGTVMQGLSRLFSRLYGVRLVPGEVQPGETWNDDVRRLDVVDEADGHIAVIYCDLFERANKSPNPAHFTLRCSREIAPSEIELAIASGAVPATPSLRDLETALNDGMALNRPSSNPSALQQLPTIGFICDFPRPRPGSSQPTLLPFSHVTTLFHEMGHCLHSILGRTKLQNVSGTRCATDFAELPSILMEHFAADPSVLGLYARRWDDDKPLDPSLVAAELNAHCALRAAAETESQILLAALDQALHSPRVPGRGSSFDSRAAYARVYADRALASVPEPQGAAWHGFFGHLFQYGAVYYSYLFDRAIAGRFWADVFEKGRGGGSLSRANGERYKSEVLRFGGSRSGWECVAGVLGPERHWMHEGGREAMEEVGRWGAGELGASNVV